VAVCVDQCGEVRLAELLTHNGRAAARRTSGKKKSFHSGMNWNNATVVSAGRIIWAKMRSSPAPSTRVASSNSIGRARENAVSTKIPNGTPLTVYTQITPIRESIRPMELAHWLF
jgi:hypothetical protein